MPKRVLCTIIMLLSSTALRATVFNFSYSGPLILNNVTASGTINATDIGSGNYQITSLTGTRNGVAISDASLANKGAFNYNFDIGSFAFLISGSGVDTVTLLGGGLFTESGVPSATFGFNFSIVDPPSPAAPESVTLALLLTMGLGVWLIARKSLARNTP